VLPLPKPNPRRIVILGDTGCRLRIGDPWQACSDPPGMAASNDRRDRSKLHLPLTAGNGGDNLDLNLPDPLHWNVSFDELRKKGKRFLPA
jgi:hypothetical protein